MVLLVRIILIDANRVDPYPLPVPLFSQSLQSFKQVCRNPSRQAAELYLPNEALIAPYVGQRIKSRRAAEFEGLNVVFDRCGLII
jgi:hypothetical protein